MTSTQKTIYAVVTSPSTVMAAAAAIIIRIRVTVKY
jgi:hypothetical protein